MKKQTTKKRYKVDVPIYTSGLLFLERDEELSKEDLLKSVTKEEMRNFDFCGTDWKSVRHSITPNLGGDYPKCIVLDEILVEECDENWDELN
jgi:hypothetical protein